MHRACWWCCKMLRWPTPSKDLYNVVTAHKVWSDQARHDTVVQQTAVSQDVCAAITKQMAKWLPLGTASSRAHLVEPMTLCILSLALQPCFASHLHADGKKQIHAPLTKLGSDKEASTRVD